MTSSNISIPANFTDNYPERGPWLTVGSPPPAFVNVQVLRPGGTTAYQATGLGAEWWSAASFVKPLGWRSVAAA